MHSFSLRTDIYTQKGTQAESNPLTDPPNTRGSNPNSKHFSLQGKDKHFRTRTLYSSKHFILCRLFKFSQRMILQHSATLLM